MKMFISASFVLHRFTHKYVGYRSNLRASVPRMFTNFVLIIQLLIIQILKPKIRLKHYILNL